MCVQYDAGLDSGCKLIDELEKAARGRSNGVEEGVKEETERERRRVGDSKRKEG